MRSQGSTADDIRLSGVAEVARHVNIPKTPWVMRSSEFVSSTDVAVPRAEQQG